MNSDMIGSIIGNRYKLIDVRGRGNFATVYIARDLKDNQIYAVKVMHHEHSNDGEQLVRFQREAGILLDLSDKHIVRILDYGNDHNKHYIVMDYIDGQSLKYYLINQGSLELFKAIHYAWQIAEGLDTAYKQGIVHRDIKPQNILITSSDMVKITDFGLARRLNAIGITQSNVIMGTAHYMAPEQATDGRLADTCSDLYSLATVFFEMLTGKLPYEGETAMDVVIKHMKEKIPSVCRQNPSLPIEIDAFMQKAMAKSPTERFATPQEFIAGLEQLQECIQAMSPELVVRPPIMPINQEQGSLQLAIHTPEAQFILLSTGQTFPLKGELMIVGRKDPIQGIYPEVLFTDKTVGRKHAYIQNQQGTYTIEDLNALNKTRLNGVILTPHEKRTLKDGDVLRFGSVEVRFELR